MTQPNDFRDRILSTRHGQFDISGWDGSNGSGIDPVCDKVVVRVDRASQVTRGGIQLPQDAAERQTLSATTGVLVAVGPQAFAWNSDRSVRWEGVKPQPGDRICFSRYAGQEYDGKDGNMYRVMEDRCIAGTQGRAPLPCGEIVGSSTGIIQSTEAAQEAA